MKNRAALAILLALLLMGMLTLAFNIQPVGASGTIYIRADGSIDPPTAPIQRDGDVYTFTDNIYDSIVVEMSNMTIDGKGYTLYSPMVYESKGIDLSNVNNVTIKSMNINGTMADTSRGIDLSNASDVIIWNTNIEDFHYGPGIHISQSSNNTIIENDITNNSIGIRLVYSSNITISGNNVTNNRYEGISLVYSSNNVLRDNVLAGNRWNFGVDGLVLSDFMNDVDVSNLVDEKPIFYLVNKKNIIINPQTYPDIGYLAVINSTNIIARHLNMKNNSQGILLAHTKNSLIQNVTSVGNEYGIWFSHSSNNTICENIVTNNFYGIWTEYSSNVNIFENNASKNVEHGIRLRYTDGCQVIDNIANGNYDGYGIWLTGSSEDILAKNIANGNYNYNIVVEKANNTIIAENVAEYTDGRSISIEGEYCSVIRNVARDSFVGLEVGGASENIVAHGNLMENNEYGLRDYSSKSLFYHNNFINNTQGHVYVRYAVTNTWDNGYPSGGNYWSDYTDVDLYSGPHQNETGSDGIWDHPYVIDEFNQDNYPLVHSWGSTIGNIYSLVRDTKSIALWERVEDSLVGLLEDAVYFLEHDYRFPAIVTMYGFTFGVYIYRWFGLLPEPQASHLITKAMEIIYLIWSGNRIY